MYNLATKKQLDKLLTSESKRITDSEWNETDNKSSAFSQKVIHCQPHESSESSALGGSWESKIVPPILSAAFRYWGLYCKHDDNGDDCFWVRPLGTQESLFNIMIMMTILLPACSCSPSPGPTIITLRAVVKTSMVSKMPWTLSRSASPLPSSSLALQSSKT